ncbi:TolC family protein [Pseudoflavitalea sp. G-6-1-2]|uniref:TolC family protein n=1 Tax=Pseudoflavitalea sp. G-6-1-2 TaxID=2728841 RepID=UPI00146C4075|nr:TolC family protein [Pseudoflavitalea sp. G-6-1-2]NML22596.1 TolC family protein [Pseudoflavitalea sp. G-6-1-2]
MNIHYSFKKIILAAFAWPVLIQAKAQTMELSLEQALRTAAKGNRSLLIRSLEYSKSELAIKEAKSYRLPEVSLNSSYLVNTELPVIYLRNEQATPKPGDVQFSGRYAFLATLQARYALINPANRSNIKLAGIDNELKREEAKNTEESLALDISTLYLRILLLKEQQTVLQQSLQRNELALSDSRLLFIQGKNLKSDTLSNFIAVQNLRAGLSELRNNSVVQLQQLKQLLGLNAATELILTDSLVQSGWNPDLLPITENVSQSVAGRTDLKMQSLQLNRSRIALEQVKAVFRPKLHAIGAYQLQAQADHPQPWNYAYPRSSFVGLSLDIPIYSGSRLSHKSRQSGISIQQNELALAELESVAQTEVITLKANLNQAYDQWQIQKQNVEAAKVNFDMVSDRYRHGLGTRLELSDAELALTKNKLGILQTSFSLQLAELQLKKATGQLKLKSE